MNKTRNELQKEINYLKSVIVELEDKNCSSSILCETLTERIEKLNNTVELKNDINAVLTNKNEQLQSELEQEKQLVIAKDEEIQHIKSEREIDFKLAQHSKKIIEEYSNRIEELESENNGKNVEVLDLGFTNKRLINELEEQKQEISNYKVDVAGYILALNDFRNDFKKLEKINIDAVSAKQLAEKELSDFKLKTFFQLIRWWLNAKN